MLTIYGYISIRFSITRRNTVEILSAFYIQSVSLACLNLQSHNSVLLVTKELINTYLHFASINNKTSNLLYQGNIFLKFY